MRTIEETMSDISYDEIGHKCIDCKKWICDIPEKLECLSCKKKREVLGICGEPMNVMASAVMITKCSNCGKFIYKEYTPEGSSV